MTDSSKKRIEFITIEPKCSKRLKTNDDSGSVIDEFHLELDDISEEKLSEINTSINKYIKIFEEKMLAFNYNNYQKFIQHLISTIDKLKVTNVKFIKTSQFKNLFICFSEDLEKFGKNSKTIIDFNNDLIKELMRLTSKPTSTHNLDSKKVAKKIEKLTLRLVAINEKIAEAESKELSLDDLEYESYYTKLPSLYRIQIACWEMREKLLNRSVNTGLSLYSKFEYNGTANSKINKIITNYFTSYLIALKENEENIIQRGKNKKSSKGKIKNFEFFTIINLKAHLKEKIENQKIDFELTDCILEKIYKDLTLENKNRRSKMEHEAIESLEYCEHITPEKMATDDDPEIIKKLNDSEIEGTKALENLIEKFKKKDFDLHGEDNKSSGEQWIGWDDHSDDEESDEEDEEEKSNDEDAENRDKDNIDYNTTDEDFD